MSCFSFHTPILPEGVLSRSCYAAAIYFGYCLTIGIYNNSLKKHSTPRDIFLPKVKLIDNDEQKPATKHDIKTFLGVYTLSDE